MHGPQYKFSQVISSIELTPYKDALHKKYPHLTMLQEIAKNNEETQEVFDKKNFIALDKIYRAK